MHDTAHLLQQDHHQHCVGRDGTRLRPRRCIVNDRTQVLRHRREPVVGDGKVQLLEQRREACNQGCAVDEVRGLAARQYAEVTVVREPRDLEERRGRWDSLSSLLLQQQQCISKTNITQCGIRFPIMWQCALHTPRTCDAANRASHSPHAG